MSRLHRVFGGFFLCLSFAHSVHCLDSPNLVTSLERAVAWKPGKSDKVKLKPFHEAHLQYLFPEAEKPRKSAFQEICDQSVAAVQNVKAVVTSPEFIPSIFPFVGWLPQYIEGKWKKYLLKDISAGIVIGIMLVPQAIAYALVATIPAQYGFFACIVPSLVYMLFGTSRHVHVGVNAPISMMVAVSIRDCGAKTADQRVSFTLTLTALTSIIYLAMMALRLDLIATFVPDPVVSGFCTAMALQIMSSNLKHIFGLPLSTDNPVAAVIGLVRNFRAANPAAIAVFAAGCGLLVGIKRLNARHFRDTPVPEQLVLLVAATLLSRVFQLHRTGVAVVGPVPVGLLPPRLPRMEAWRALLQPAATIAFVNFVLSSQVAGSLGSLHDYRVSPRQELLALSLASGAGCLFGSLPPSASFSRSALLGSLDVGSPLHNLVSAAVVAGAATLLGSNLADLPLAALAAVVVVALQSMLQFSRASFLLRVSPPEFVLWVGSCVSTLALGPTQGIVLSLAMAVGMILQFQSAPHCCHVGRLPNTDIFRDAVRFPQAVEERDILIFRFDSSLHFANRLYFEDRLLAEFRRRTRIGRRVRALVLDASGINNVDSSGALALRALLDRIRHDGVRVYLVRWKGRSRDLFRRLRIEDTLPPNKNFFTVAEAVAIAHAELAAADAAAAAAAAAQATAANHAAAAAAAAAVTNTLRADAASAAAAAAAAAAVRERDGMAAMMRRVRCEPGYTSTAAGQVIMSMIRRDLRAAGVEAESSSPPPPPSEAEADVLDPADPRTAAPADGGGAPKGGK